MTLFDRQYRFRTLALALIAFALVTLGFAGSAWAETPLPEIPRGKGDKCVEPTDDMRKNHMNYILHQRDDTVHRGIRTTKHSLAECINCHVPEAADPQQQVHVDSPKFFCKSCHTYAGVTIDCFQCHADKPAKGQAPSALADPGEPMPVSEVDVSPRALNMVSDREK